MASLSKMTNLFLIRHGEAICNVREVMGGHKGDLGLSDLGRAQAAKLRDRLSGGEIQADVLIASTLPRAAETAEIIAPALGLKPLMDPDVREQIPGEADGLTFKEVRERPGFLDPRAHPFNRLATGAETWGEFMLRVSTALERIAREYSGRTAVIVSHGGVIDGSFVHFFRMPSAWPPPAGFTTHNTSITGWTLRDGNGTAPRWRLERYNVIVHLRDLGTAEQIPWEDLVRRPTVGHDKPAVPLASESPNGEVRTSSSDR
jgi:probable phosphoglycerate mutase